MTEGSFLENPLIGRRQYLVTYSQADDKKFPTRESFGQMIADEFNAGSGKVGVSHWACCREPHPTTSGFHYHCCVKLTGVKKWLRVKNSIKEKHNIVVNFSDEHNHYISAYRYVCKSDADVVHSNGHPDLSEVGSPRTKKSTEAYRRKRKSINSTSTEEAGPSNEPQPKKASKTPKRLSNIEVSDFIRKNGIKTYEEIFAVAESRKENGELDLASFVMSRSEKIVNEIIKKSWLLHTAATDIARTSVSRMDLIFQAFHGDCVEGCVDKLWLKCATEVLDLNRVDVHYYAHLIRESLKKGRGKFRNVLLIGDTNCAKSFMFAPLKVIFDERCFDNPSNDKYGWIGADKADVILLQDFRYSREQIAWKDLLLLLEGETVKLPAPKNHFVNDIVIKGNVAIFATGPDRVRFKGFNNIDKENRMMDSRWKVIEFKHEFEENQQISLKPCSRCFAELVLTGHEVSD